MDRFAVRGGTVPGAGNHTTMALMREKQSIGLDLGQSSAKLVQLALRGKEVKVLRTAVFDAQSEGLLDQAEMFAGTASWLKEMGLADHDVCIGLAQHLATTQVSDFPPNASGDELLEMLNYETVQLTGLSDEVFASGYHVLTPEYGRKNPVLIGICRQATVDDRSNAFAQEGMHVGDVAMEGLAAANALFFLHPEVLAEKAPSLVLDIGAEASTLLVVAGGQVLFVGALLFGANTFAKHLTTSAGDAGGSATAGPAEVRFDPQQFDSPLVAANRRLEAEIRNSIEHWRAGERPEVAGQAFAKVWVSGGGARLKGLAESLGLTHGCTGEVFGPAGEDGQPSPQLAIALGLALQGLGVANVAITLCPESIRWARLRVHRFGYLLATVIILVALTVLFLFRYSRQLDRSAEELGAQIANLNRCRELIPKLEENSQLIQHYEKTLLPIVEKANRAGRFIKSIEALGAAQGEGDWFIYLADEFSFDEGKPKDDKEAAPTARERAAAPQEVTFPGAITSLDGSDSGPPPIQATLVSSMEQMRSMVMAGHSPRSARDVLEPVRAIRARLNEGGLFKGADVLPKPERIGREEEIFQPWITYLQSLADRRLTGTYVSYMFRLPFAALDISKPAIAAPAPKSKAPKPPPPPPATDRLDE